MGLFSTGTENKDLSGFSGIDLHTREGKGALIGRIFSYIQYQAFHTSKGNAVKNR